MSLLEVQGLRKTFGGLVAVNDLSFTVERGQIVGLLGPNGSGKTTAMNLISGALQPEHGAVVFKGHDIAGRKPHHIARLGIARSFQLVRVLGSMSCRENVQAGLAFHAGGVFGRASHAHADALLARVGLAGKAAQPAAALTYIDQKRLELARALALDPQLLLLDEWLAGLNPSELQGGISLIHQLRDEGLTLVLVEHVMDAVHALCERCVVMNAGQKIAEGPTARVLAEPQVVKAYLGEDHVDAREAVHA